MISTWHFFKAAVRSAERFDALEASASTIQAAARDSGDEGAKRAEEDSAAALREAEAHQRAAQVRFAGAVLAAALCVAVPIWAAVSELNERWRFEARSEAWRTYAETPGLGPVPKADALMRCKGSELRAGLTFPWAYGIGWYVLIDGVLTFAAVAIGKREVGR